MTFRLVTIDTSRADHKGSFPKRSYYLQESRLTWAQHSAFRKAAFGDGTYETITWHHNSGHPTQWREWSEYAQTLSKFDAEYDYRIPSRSEWTFACMSGYVQSCDKTKPNVYGITGLIDTKGSAEVVEDVIDGSKLRVVMGHWVNNWGEHQDETKPKCSCEHWTACNPDADDSLDEIISGRFVLIPKQAVDTGQADGVVASNAVARDNEYDADAIVTSGMEMTDAIEIFNERGFAWQKLRNIVSNTLIPCPF
ncbi:MAG: hypothetical protein KDB00_19665 [Planctomycetales bacterium]|nr:hypothetical protein [Planctomycetales bacterium]